MSNETNRCHHLFTFSPFALAHDRATEGVDKKKRKMSRRWREKKNHNQAIRPHVQSSSLAKLKLHLMDSKRKTTTHYIARYCLLQQQTIYWIPHHDRLAATVLQSVVLTRSVCLFGKIQDKINERRTTMFMHDDIMRSTEKHGRSRLQFLNMCMMYTHTI